jgi:cysteine-rich repeat protein
VTTATTSTTDGCPNSCFLHECGDGIINESCETCDTNAFPANAPSSHGACRPGPCGQPAACTFCGDGIVNDGELCDDGNNIDTDGCPNNCTSVDCGDGIINGSCETCDTNAFPAGAPSSHGPCHPGPCGQPGACTFCGDGIVNNGETCDDGNANDNDSCRNNCTPPICGDSIINNSGCNETCDNGTFPAGAPSSHGPCRPGPCGQPAACTFCGDGIVNDGELCDDGNAVNTDSCGNDCTSVEACSVIIANTVAPDDGSGGGTACDGVADGPFVESVTVDQTTCVVYQICVTNTSFLVTSDVKVSDPVLGTVNLDYGTIAPGQTVCKQTAAVFTAPNCTGGNPTGTSCVCSEVAGVNTRHHHFRRLSGKQPGRLCFPRLRLLGHGQHGLPRAWILPHDRWTQFRRRGRHVQ